MRKHNDSHDPHPRLWVRIDVNDAICGFKSTIEHLLYDQDIFDEELQSVFLEHAYGNVQDALTNVHHLCRELNTTLDDLIASPELVLMDIRHWVSDPIYDYVSIEDGDLYEQVTEYLCIDSGQGTGYFHLISDYQGHLSKLISLLLVRIIRTFAHLTILRPEIKLSIGDIVVHCDDHYLDVYSYDARSVNEKTSLLVR